MKSIWNDDESDVIGIFLKYLLKWITLVSLIIIVITTLVKLFELYGYGG